MLDININNPIRYRAVTYGKTTTDIINEAEKELKEKYNDTDNVITELFNIIRSRILNNKFNWDGQLLNCLCNFKMDNLTNNCWQISIDVLSTKD